MRAVIFGDYNTATDWNLILNAKHLVPPTPKTVYVSVDGRDGDLDLSDALTGEVKYENREATFTFLLTEGTYAERQALISRILGVLHGKKLNITLPDDNSHYLVGRCTITDYTNDKAFGVINIACNCEPWLYANETVIRPVTVSGSAREFILINNGVKTIVPEITVTGSITLAYDGSSVSLSDGVYKLTSLKVQSGSKIITVDGTGSATFTYREGVL